MSFVRMVEVWRGPLVESSHAGIAAVANSRGELIAGWGDTDLVTFPRSALKPVQAIALVETGAYQTGGLTARHLAIACASHRGEAKHTALLSSWLGDMGLDQEHLICGPDRPADEAAADAAVIAGQPRQRIFHNCSGKHCGFLAVTRHNGWPIEGYDDPAHPAQQRYLDALTELAGTDASTLPFGVDGCGLPAPALPISAMAVVMARFAEAQVASTGRRTAVLAIHGAMRAHPDLLSGTDDPATLLTRATRSRIIMKTGAEGFLTAFVPGQGLGIALKIDDGSARARVPALIAVLSSVGLLDAGEQKALSVLAQPSILNSAGAVVGRIDAVVPARPPVVS